MISTKNSVFTVFINQFEKHLFYSISCDRTFNDFAVKLNTKSFCVFTHFYLKPSFVNCVKLSEPLEPRVEYLI